MVCDALDLKGVEAVLDGCDAAITTMGGVPEGDEAKRVDYAGNRNVIESAGILGITRVVMVTSFLAFGWAFIPFSIWMGHPWSNCIRFLIDALIYAAIVAGIFAWLWPAAS